LLFVVVSALDARAADDAGWMFDPGVVVRVDLGLSHDALAALAVEPDEYVAATFTMTWAEKRFGPWAVSLRLKGKLGSFRGMDGKAAFKLKFPSGARPDGLKKLTLNNMVQDPSKVREAVAYELFRALGIAAPHTGYADVTVNGASYGLYLNVETMDEVALPRWYGSTRHLYEGEYGFLGDPTDPFDAHYEVDVGDEDDRADLAALMTAATDPADGWYARMAAVADLEQMTRMWAVEAYVGHWDGYSGLNTNNYYLHSDAAGRFTMIPWGTDYTLVARTGFHDGAAQHVLFNRCVGDPICGALYADALVAVTATAKRLRLGKRATEIHRGIRARIETEPKLEHSLDEVRTALRSAVSFTTRRRTDVGKWSARLPRGPRAIAVEGGATTIATRWARPIGRSASSITGYAVEYRRAGGMWVRVTTPPSETALTLTDVPAGTYDVRVRTLTASAASTTAGVATVIVGP
jgi:hypothetical protein